jgi:biopolymer transport protein ExbD
MYRPPKKKQLGQEAIPTTSLADMMFLLLIFFIMTTTLARVTGFVSDMPAGAPVSQKTQPTKTPTVRIDGDRVLLNDKEIDREQLPNLLQNLRLSEKTGEGKVVIVAATGEVKYQLYYEVLAEISASGGVVAIMTEEAEEKK